MHLWRFRLLSWYASLLVGHSRWRLAACVAVSLTHRRWFLASSIQRSDSACNEYKHASYMPPAYAADGHRRLFGQLSSDWDARPSRTHALTPAQILYIYETMSKLMASVIDLAQELGSNRLARSVLAARGRSIITPSLGSMAGAHPEHERSTPGTPGTAMRPSTLDSLCFRPHHTVGGQQPGPGQGPQRQPAQQPHGASRTCRLSPESNSKPILLLARQLLPVLLASRNMGSTAQLPRARHAAPVSPCALRFGRCSALAVLRRGGPAAAA